MLLNSVKTSLRTLSTTNIARKMTLATGAHRQYKFETLSVTEANRVYHVVLNRPERYNAFNETMWKEIDKCFFNLSNESNCRAIVLSANGKHFTAGFDLMDSSLDWMDASGADLINKPTDSDESTDAARKARPRKSEIERSVDEALPYKLEQCRKPIIVAIHSGCVGEGVNFITATDIRYCTDDAWFSLKHVDIDFNVNVRRLPKVIANHSKLREICFTGRRFDSREAYDMGVVSKVFQTKDEMLIEAIKLAETIASKRPEAVQDMKCNFFLAFDHQPKGYFMISIILLVVFVFLLLK